MNKIIICKDSFSFNYKDYEIHVYMPYPSMDCYAKAYIWGKNEGKIEFYKKFNKKYIIKICKKWIHNLETKEQ